MYEIVKNPDPRLKEKVVATVTEKFGTNFLRDVVSRMVFTMKRGNGVGLAANQVGIMDERIIIIDTRSKKKNPDAFFGALINPVVVNEMPVTEDGEEGCLSFPNEVISVKRKTEIEVEYFNIDGYKQRRKFRGLSARAVQHEIDHLNGITFRDR
jgi:peptide deformylase